MFIQTTHAHFGLHSIKRMPDNRIRGAINGAGEELPQIAAIERCGGDAALAAIESLLILWPSVSPR